MNDQHNENGPTSRGNDYAGPGTNHLETEGGSVPVSDSIHTTTDSSAEQRAWDEITRLTSAPGGPGAAWRWSIPAKPERDSDLILAAGLQDLRDRLDAVAALHSQGGIVVPNSGYPAGWCEHDRHPWPCPTTRLLNGQAL